MQHCVPKHAALLESQYRALEEFILSARRLLVLTGAGLSTESGSVFIHTISCVKLINFSSTSQIIKLLTAIIDREFLPAPQYFKDFKIVKQ